MQNETKRKYCARGERWNNKTKKCEKKDVFITITTPEAMFNPNVATVLIPVDRDAVEDILRPITPTTSLITGKSECPPGTIFNNKTKKCVNPISAVAKYTRKQPASPSAGIIIQKRRRIKLTDGCNKDYMLTERDQPRYDELYKRNGQELRDILSQLRGEPTGQKTSRGANLKPELIRIIICLENERGVAEIPEQEEEEEEEKEVEEEEKTEIPESGLEAPLPEAIPTEELEEGILPITELDPEPTFTPESEPFVEIIQEESMPLLDITESAEEIELQKTFENMDIDSKKQYNDFLKEKELIEYKESLSGVSDVSPSLYPTLNDSHFNAKIAARKEFNDTKYDGSIYNIRDQADILCNSSFELLPHQLFVKNFLSFQTPYNSLLLYHGLGTGKTCSAIGVAEEMRAYMKQIGLNQQILIVASPNVQDNFRVQLFDERKLKLENGLWNLDTCIGNTLINEVNPTNLIGLTKERVSNQINTIINQSYKFMGYIELANFITRKTKVPEDSGYTDEQRKQIEIKKIRRIFSNQLIIIDEVHNIRLTDENKQKKVASLLMRVSRYADNLRLLLLSATPMYNSYKEIIWLTNLMNIVDKKSVISESDVFDKDGEFKVERIDANGKKLEGGRELLQRKLTGYVSYIRGENPYTFPYRVYPTVFSPENTVAQNEYPTMQMNNKPIVAKLSHVPVYLTPIGEYQQLGYDFIIQHLRNKTFNVTTQGEEREMPTFENMDSFGYNHLKEPLEALNIVYPNPEFDAALQKPEPTSIESITSPTSIESEKSQFDNNSDLIKNIVGKQGLSNIMTYKTVQQPQPLRYDFKYKPEVLSKYGSIFSMREIHKYSNKISQICKSIRDSTGIVLVYSQYIDGGLVPIALALEEMGFSRYGSASHTKSLFNTPPTPPTNNKYVMITGDKAFSPDNKADIKYATDSSNKNGEKVKVILISRAGAEGLDFKNIRQVHLLEPWYNMNRTEQIIGRGVRNLSHCGLPFEERNVELYLHATLPRNNEEPADLYVYRFAEKKAIQIGKITRILKEVSVDCLLNIGQNNFTVDKLTQMVQNQNIVLRLSSHPELKFEIGDKPYTDICDYMDNCSFTCSPFSTQIESEKLIMDTYNTDFVKMNYINISKRIKDLYRERSVYTRDQLISAINAIKEYPREQIFYAFTRLVDGKTDYIIDKYGRTGVLMNKGFYYAFQPLEISDATASTFERTAPVDYKREFLAMDLPLEKVTTVDTVAEITTQVGIVPAKVAVPTEAIETNYEGILLRMRENIAYANTKSTIEAGEQNWYKHIGYVLDILSITHEIPNEEMVRYIIYHMLDTMPIANRLLLVRHLYLNGEMQMLGIEQIIKSYFDKKILEYGGKRGIVLADGDKNTIYVQTIENPSEWREATPTEEERFQRSGFMKFILPRDNANSLIGFMNVFKEKEVVFKIKNLDEKRNKGVNCSVLLKADVIKRLNMVLGEQVYTNENAQNLLKPALCAMQEIIMRHNTDNKKNGKIWFLDVEESIINDIPRYKR